MANPTEQADATGIEAWFTPGRFALLLTVLLCACFSEVLIGRATFFLRDYAVFSYPLAHYQRECFWQGEVPLWNPLSYCGIPFLAQWNTLCLYPPALFYLLLPLSWALGVFCVAHLWFGGMGMYYLAYRWTGNRFAAAVGGVTFAFTAVMINFLMWPGNVAAMGWLPWVVLAMEKAWREGGRALWLAALAGGMQMLAGAPEVLMQTWGFLAVLFVFDCVRERTDRWWRAGRFALVLLLVGGLSAAQLLPFLDLLSHSQRDTGFGASTWAMPLWGWANYLVPLFRTNFSALGVYTQPGQSWICSYYLGAGTLLLAVLAVVHVRTGRVRLLAGLVIFCLLMALGDPGGFYLLLRKGLPFLGLMRYPVKFVILPAFLMPLLAAMFMGHYMRCPTSDWPRLRRHIIGTGGVVVILAGLIVCAAYFFPMSDVSAGIATGSGLSRILFLILVVGMLALARGRVRLWPVGLLVVLWLDPLTLGPRLAPTVDRSAYTPGLAPYEMKLQSPPRLGESRFRLGNDAERALSVPSMSNAVEHVIYNRLGESGNLNLLDNIPKVGGFFPLLPENFNDINVLLYYAPELPAGLADFLGVSHVNAPGKTAEWMVRPTHRPWVTGGQRPVFADARTTLAALGRADFDPRTTVYLPPEAAQIMVTNVSIPAIEVRQFTARRVQVEVKASEPALIVIAQTWYRHWHAYVDEQPVPLLPANHAFQAVLIPAGDHELKVVYQDRNFQVGVVLSLFTLAVCGDGLWRTRRKPV